MLYEFVNSDVVDKLYFIAIIVYKYTVKKKKKSVISVNQWSAIFLDSAEAAFKNSIRFHELFRKKIKIF